MKRLFILNFLALWTIHAVANTMSLSYIAPDSQPGQGPTDDPKNGNKKGPARNLSISCFDNLLIITSPYLIDDVEIIIYDEDDNAIYSIVTSLEATDNVFILSQNVVENMFYIKVVYNNHHYLLYF